MTYDLETTIDLPGEEDVDILVEFEVTSWGSPGTGPSFTHPGDPPEGPEFDIISVIRSDNGEDIVKTLSDDDCQKLGDIVAERIYELEQERGYGYDD